MRIPLLRQPHLIAAGAALVAAMSLAACGDDSDNPNGATADGVASPMVTEQATQPEADALPTPDAEGNYLGVTFEQAQQLTPFELVAPESVPDGLSEPSIMLTSPPALRPGAAPGEPNEATMIFDVIGNEPQGSVQFIQRAGTGALGSEGETTTVEIRGREVNRTMMSNIGGTPILVYWWQDDDVYRSVFALLLSDDLTEEMVEELVAAIPA